MSERYRECAKAKDVWDPRIFKLREAPVYELRSWEDIRKATMLGLPLISQTKIRNAETGMEAIIECPVKTMNLSPERKMFQVDTGPLCYPDLSKQHSPQINHLSVAFIAFNSGLRADFIIEQPTRIMGEGREICQIYHYPDPFNREPRTPSTP